MRFVLSLLWPVDTATLTLATAVGLALVFCIGATACLCAPLIPPAVIETHVALLPEPDTAYPTLQVRAPHVGKALYEATLVRAVQRLVQAVVAEGTTVYVPAVVGRVTLDVPGVAFSLQPTIVPL